MKRSERLVYMCPTVRTDLTEFHQVTVTKAHTLYESHLYHKSSRGKSTDKLCVRYSKAGEERGVTSNGPGSLYTVMEMF